MFIHVQLKPFYEVEGASLLSFASVILKVSTKYVIDDAFIVITGCANLLIRYKNSNFDLGPLYWISGEWLTDDYLQLTYLPSIVIIFTLSTCCFQDFNKQYK